MDAPDNPDPTLEAQEDVAEEQVLAQLQTRMDAAISNWENAPQDEDYLEQYACDATAARS